MPDVLNRTYKSEQEKKYHILYVDDEEVNLRIFERAFKKYYEVYTANSGKDAIKLLQKQRMDLIMTDQRMPNMTGVELLIEIVPHYPNIVRMIMTGFSDEEEILKVDETVGLDRFLVKPWNQDELKGEFDRALHLRYGKENEEGDEDVVEEKVKANPLDLVESTLSLVESDEMKQLKSEIADLVETNKSKKGPEFFESDTNDLLNLKESLMPGQQEIKLYLSDSIIVYDGKSMNKNGYWFGEIGDHFILTSFYTDTDPVRALTLNTFIGVMMTEMVYRDKNIDAGNLIHELSNRISGRFVDKVKKNVSKVDMSVIVIDNENDTLSHSGANHSLFYFNSVGKFEVLRGNKDSLIAGKEMEFGTSKIEMSEIKEMYFIPQNIIEETNEGSEESLKLFLDEIHKYPMKMQAKLFDEYKYKSIIGLRV